jgi:hypothetical protein
VCFVPVQGHGSAVARPGAAVGIEARASAPLCRDPAWVTLPVGWVVRAGFLISAGCALDAGDCGDDSDDEQVNRSGCGQGGPCGVCLTWMDAGSSGMFMVEVLPGGFGRGSGSPPARFGATGSPGRVRRTWRRRPG